MKIRLSQEQAQWLMAMTGTDSTQDGVNYFVDLMRKEGLNASDVLYYIDEMMKKGIKPGDI